MQIAKAMSRLGTENAFTVLAEANALKAAGKDIKFLAIGQPNFQTPEHIVNAAVKSLQNGAHGYINTSGTIEMRECIARKVKTLYGAEISPDNFLVVPGGKPTMFFAMSMFGQEGAEIMYPDPGFPIYKSMIDFSGAKAVSYGLPEDKGFSLDVDEVLSKITDKTSLIVINFPGNPTGGMIAKSEMDKLVAGLKKHPNVAIMSDEIYSRLVYDQEKYTSFFHYPEMRDQLIVLEGWSKAYAMTGWRMGWSYWPDNLIGKAVQLAVNDHSCPVASFMDAGIAALDGPDDCIDIMMEKFTERRDIIVESLNQMDGITCNNPGGAFYAFPNIKGTGMTGKEFASRALNEQGVAILPGTAFGDRCTHNVRFSFAASNEDINIALDRIQKMLKTTN